MEADSDEKKEDDVALPLIFRSILHIIRLRSRQRASRSEAIRNDDCSSPYSQARFQAQQMAEKEEKLINLLEQRQEEAVRRVAYNGSGGSRGESAHSLSSGNSSNSLGPGSATLGRGRRGPVGGERRRTVGGSEISAALSPTTAEGWDKSYPLKPVNGTLYRRHNSNAGSINTLGRNKYSGNYGPKAMAARSSSQTRVASLERNRQASTRAARRSRG